MKNKHSVYQFAFNVLRMKLWLKYWLMVLKS